MCNCERHLLRQAVILGLKQEAADLGRYSIHIAIVLSLVLSFSVVVILSKQHPSNSLWVGLIAFVVPMTVALYFRNRIVLLGFVTYVAALIVALVTAVLFGI